MTGKWTKENQEYWDKPENRLLFEFNCLFTSKNYWELNQDNVKPMNEDLRKLFKNFLEKESNRVQPVVSPKIAEGLEIVFRNDKPHGIRNRGGYLFLFVNLSKYPDQDERYEQEMEEQIKLANYLYDTIKLCQ